jgi:hypothetical protein
LPERQPTQFDVATGQLSNAELQQQLQRAVELFCLG